MANKREPFKADCFYHIYNQSVGESRLFKEEKNFYYFLEKCSIYIPPIADIYAYCLLPNHFHLLVKFRPILDIMHVLDPDNKAGVFNVNKRISNRFGTLQNSYATAFNIYYRRRGSLFFHSLKRKEIRHESYLRNVILYIHQNPVMHGFTSSVEEWKFSSCHAYYHGKSSLVQTELGMKYLPAKESLRKFHESRIDPAFLVEMGYEY